MRVALVSLDQSWQDKAANLERCRELTAAAHNQNCALIIFPEMTLTGYSLDVDKLAEHEGRSQAMEAFSALAAEYKIDIVFGICLYRNNETRPYNVLAHASADHQSVPIYAKFHPFTFAGEEKVIAPGESLGFLKSQGLVFGASICYDLRFPTLYSLMASKCKGAICIANWPVGRIQHWQSLLVARAIENQMYMIGVNRIGSDGNGLVYEKSSMVVAPDGRIFHPEERNRELDVYEIDPEETARYRVNFPTLSDSAFPRYLKAYKKLNIENGDHSADN